MNKASARLLIVLLSVSLFALGFMIRDFMNDESKPTYLESLSDELGLTGTQVEKIRKLLDEEDRLIAELLDGKHGEEIRRGIAEIRGKISSRIAELLNTEQKGLFQGAEIEKGNSGID